jgi:adenine-specific DNA-methyltransferase
MPFFNPPIENHFNSNADLVLYNGNVSEFVATIPDNTVSLVITSPPYNLGKDYEKRISIDNYLNIQEKVIAQLYRVLKNNGSLCWQVGNFVENGEVYPLDILYYMTIG